MRATTVAVTAVLAACAVAGCADKTAPRAVGESPTTTTTSSPSPGVPPEFAPACGKPGAEVVTERSHVVIARSACELTGVVIVHRGRGLTVPSSGGAGGPGVSVNVSGDTLTFVATE